MDPSKIIGIVVAVLLAVSLVPTIANSAAAAAAAPNVTGVSDTLLGLVPFLFVVMIVLGAVYFVKSK